MLLAFDKAMFHLIVTLFLAFIIWQLATYIKWRRTIYNAILKLPGPPRYPILGTEYYFFGVPKEELFSTMVHYVKEFSPFFCTWNGSVPEIHLIKADYVAVILNNSVHITKGIQYNGLHPWLGEGLLTSTGEKWFQHRKLITPTFHFKILGNFLSIFVEKTEELLKILDTKGDGQIFKISSEITKCTLDIICETAMGVNVKAMSGEDNEYIKAIYSISEIIMWKFLRPYIPDFVFRFLPKGRRFRRNLSILHGFSKQIIANRKKFLQAKPLTNQEKIDDENESLCIRKKLSFLDLLVAASEDGKVLNDTEIREEVDTFMFEGHDTTTAAMSWALLLLGNHPEIQEKAYEEIKSILPNKPIPTTINELNELKYLECIIKESLRLFPSVPFIKRHLKQDIQLDQYTVPADTQALIHIYCIQRSPDYYPDPDRFDPDRFLPENVAKRHPYAYIPFSAGPRNCIGQKFAIYEEKIILASIINRYKITSVYKTEDVKIIPDLILRPHDGISVTLYRR